MSKYIVNLFQTKADEKDLKEMTLHDLVYFIQPLWNKFKMGRGEDTMTETEMDNLTVGLKVYKDRGLDIGYFTNGAGAPGNCIIA